MVIGPKLKLYGMVLGIFVLGAGAGAASGYAVANKRLAAVLGEDGVAQFRGMLKPLQEPMR